MTTTNELGQVRKDYQDGYGRLSKVEEYTGAGSTLYATTTYGYDQQGLLTSIHDNAGNDTEFTFDALGHRIGLNDPDAGVLAFSYDGLGRLASQTDARLQRLDFSYDLASRTTARTGTPFGGSATTLATYAYDAGGAAANALGRRTSMSDLSGSTTYAYDARGRTTSTVQTILGSVYTTGYAYDALDRPTTTTYPDGEQVTTAYGANGLPTTLAGSSTYISAQTYDALGRPLVRTFGSGVTASFDYYDTPNETDHDGVIQPQDFRLRSLTYANGATTLQTSEYRYDRAGNTTKWWETLDTGAVTTWTFGYDDLDRLTTASAANPPGGATPNFSYSYDPLGRITQGPSGTYSYSDPTHAHAATAVGTFSYSYDANGAATSRGELGTTYTHSYDLEGRQSSVTTSGATTSFTYTGDGELVAKSVGGTTVLHVAAGGLYEKDPSTGAVTKYYKLGGALVAVRDTSLHYLGHDHLNSTTLQTSASGAIEGVQWRAPYGEPWFSSGALSTDRQYTGQRSFESSLGSLYDYGARSYDPIIHRFLSPDPVGTGGDPQMLDAYAYVRDNPLSFTDPTGAVAATDGDGGACVDADCATYKAYNATTVIDAVNAATSTSIVGDEDTASVASQVIAAEITGVLDNRPSAFDTFVAVLAAGAPLVPVAAAAETSVAWRDNRNWRKAEIAQIQEEGRTVGCSICGKTDASTYIMGHDPDMIIAHNLDKLGLSAQRDMRIVPECPSCSLETARVANVVKAAVRSGDEARMFQAGWQAESLRTGELFPSGWKGSWRTF